MLHVPFRGGVRGGKDQFTWESVKSDKDREYYLGHSIKAPVGRWQKGKDIHWYASDKNAQASAKMEEFQKAKELEDKALMARLGFKVVDKPKEEIEIKKERSDSDSDSEPERESKSKHDIKAKVSGPTTLTSSDKKKLDNMLKRLVTKNGLDKVLKALMVESEDEEKSHKKSKKEKKHKSKKKSDRKQSSDESSDDEYVKKKPELKRRHSRERDFDSKRTHRSK